MRRPNTFVFQPDSSSTQLSYALQINPVPLIVSTPGASPVLASLEFIITNSTSDALPVQSVQFTLLVGGGAGSITPSTAGITCQPTDTTQWNVDGPSGTITSGQAVYTLEPVVGTAVSLASGASVSVQLFQMQTNTTPGTSSIGVTEMVNSESASTSFEVTTFPSGFYFDGLAATVQSGSALVPVAQVLSGTKVTLVWDSSVVDTDAFTIYYSDASNGQCTESPENCGFWPSPPLTSDTVFTVTVTVDIEGGQPLTVSLTTVVSVQNPFLIATDVKTTELAVSGITALADLFTTGTLTAFGDSILRIALVSETLNVLGASTFAHVSAQNLMASGNVVTQGVVKSGALITNTISAAQIFSSTQANSAGVFYNNGKFATLHTSNTTSDTSINTGIFAAVETGADWGVGSNGTIGTYNGSSIVTHLSTSIGHRVVTSPLSLYSEVQFSGQGRVELGRAKVTFEPGVADMIAKSTSYRVQLTPIGKWKALYVVSKNEHGFEVAENNSDNSSAEFDWFIVARKAKGLGEQDPHELPERMPTPPKQ